VAQQSVPLGAEIPKGLPEREGEPQVPVVVSRVPTVETVEPDDQAVCGEIKAAVAFMIRGVAKEDTPDRVRSELMRRGCSSVSVTRRAENSEMVI
jgi:hypothetical protein